MGVFRSVRECSPAQKDKTRSTIVTASHPNRVAYKHCLFTAHSAAEQQEERDSTQQIVRAFGTLSGKTLTKEWKILPAALCWKPQRNDRKHGNKWRLLGNSGVSKHSSSNNRQSHRDGRGKRLRFHPSFPFRMITNARSPSEHQPLEWTKDEFHHLIAEFLEKIAASFHSQFRILVWAEGPRL